MLKNNILYNQDFLMGTMKLMLKFWLNLSTRILSKFYWLGQRKRSTSTLITTVKLRYYILIPLHKSKLIIRFMGKKLQICTKLSKIKFTSLLGKMEFSLSCQNILFLITHLYHWKLMIKSFGQTNILEFMKNLW